MNNNQNNNGYNNSNGNSNEVFTPSTRSAYKFFNSNSSVDNTALSFTFWNCLLKISMNPIIVQEGSANKVDTNNHVDIYLSPAKAQMLLHCIKTFRATPDAYNNIGVNTNKGIIYIANGEKTFGVKGTFLVINIINNDTGEKEAEAAYEFNTKDIYGITDFNNANDFSKYYGYSNDIELDMIETLLINFVSAYTNAVASSILEANKYNDARQFSFIKDAREKLGISKNDGNKNYNKSSWFNNNNGNSSSSTVSSESPKNNTVEYEEVMNDIASIMD